MSPFACPVWKTCHIHALVSNCIAQLRWIERFGITTHSAESFKLNILE